MVPWYHGTWFLGTMVAWYQKVPNGAYHGDHGTWYYGTMVAWSHGSRPGDLSQKDATMVPVTMVQHGYHGAMYHGPMSTMLTMVPGTIYVMVPSILHGCHVLWWPLTRTPWPRYWPHFVLPWRLYVLNRSWCDLFTRPSDSQASIAAQMYGYWARV